MHAVLTENSEHSHADSGADALRGQALSCQRNERLLFENLQVRVGRGEILQIDGSNGSGKTSLIRILCGLAQASEGEVYWNGRDIHSYRSEFLRDLVYVGHMNGIKTDLSLLENMRIARALSVKGNQRNFEDVLDQLGLLEHADVVAAKLSSGQKRKLALSRLLITDCKLWILDEPLNSLDENSKVVVTEFIKQHVVNGGSLVLTTHEAIDWGELPRDTVTL